MFAAVSFLSANVIFSATVTLISVKGKVQVKTVSGEQISAETGLVLSEGEQVSTGFNGEVRIKYPNETIVELGANSKVTIERCGEENLSNLTVGVLRALVKKLKVREKFEIKTPTAVCSVRGTEFLVEVSADLMTRVSVFSGNVAARNVAGLGEEILLHPQERIEIQQNLPPGLPQKIEGRLNSQKSIQTAQTKEEVKKEVALNMSREEVQTAAAQELKLAEYQEGKSVIDAFGKRVRLEEYVMRPQPDQFKLVVLNTREDRFDYFYWLASFNDILPTDLRVATRNMWGKLGADKPKYYLTGNEQVFSNTLDSIKSKYTDGALWRNYDDSGWVTKFDKFEYLINGKEKIAYLRNGRSNWTADGYDDVMWSLLGVQKTPADMTSWVQYSRPDGADIYHESFRGDFPNNGGWLTEDYYWINDAGKIATTKDFVSMRDLSKWNQEVVFEASEFQGRKIDLIISPKVYLESQIITNE